MIDFSYPTSNSSTSPSAKAEHIKNGGSMTNDFPDVDYTLRLLGNTNLPELKPKTGPSDLEEIINDSTEAGATIMVLGDSGEITHRTNKFYLTGFNYSFKEKAQVTETLNAPVLSFFDDSVKIYNFQGSVVDYASQDAFFPGKYYHASSLTKLYNDVIRGTKLVQNKRIAIMRIANHLIYGYPLNFQLQHNASRDKLASFSMAWVVATHTLSLAGVVTEKDLESMYIPALSDDPIITKYFRSMNEVIESIDNLLNFSKWNESLAYLGRLSTVSPSQLQLELSSEVTTFVPSDIEIKIETARQVIGSRIGIAPDSDGTEISPVIYKYFTGGTSDLDSFFGDMSTRWEQYTTNASSIASDEAFSKFQGQTVLLENIRIELEIIKRQYQV